MDKLLLLTKVMLKTSLSSVGQDITRSQNKFAKYAIYIIFGLIFLPMAIMLYYLYDMILEQLIIIDQVGILINVTLAIVTIMIFILSLLQIPSIYYYSKDTENYLAMPVKPYQILGGKFFTTLVYQYVFTLFFMVPLALVMGKTNPPLSFYPMLIIITLFLPVLPLLVSSLIIMLLMNFIPLLKNKNFMSIIIGLVAIILSLMFSYSLNSMGEISEQAFLELLIQGNDSIAKLMFTFIPTINWSSIALNQADWISLAFIILVNIGLFILYIFFAQGFFLNGAQGISESARSRKVLTTEMLSKHIRKESSFLSLTKRELFDLFRTPAYLLNCVGVSILLPLIFIGSLFIPGMSTDPDIAGLTSAVSEFMSSQSNIFYSAVIGGFILGIFSGTINSISSTAISRDAYHLDALKSYPISFAKIIYSKVFSGIIISLLTIMFIFILSLFFLELPWYFYVLFLFISILSTVAVNMLIIILDIVKPKMNWTSEQQAVKQNMNSLVSIMISIAIPAMTGFIILYFNLDMIIAISLILLIILLMGLSLPLFLRIYKNRIFDYQ